MEGASLRLIDQAEWIGLDALPCPAVFSSADAIGSRLDIYQMMCL